MANMRCTVKFLLDQVTCPGTLHLPDRNPVYLTIFLFGRLQKSPHVYPSFPMNFTTKIKFQRLFTNAKTPGQVLEILEDETILIELRQHTKGLKGGRVLAQFEETARSFLFPTPSYIPKRNHLKRDILLTRSDNFPVGKGLDPQFIFRTKTYIEEGPFIHLTPDNKLVPVSRQMPASEVSPPRNKAKKKRRSLKKNASMPEVDVNDGDVTVNEQHCICDCPILENEPATFDYWLEKIREKKKKEMKPFRTGKAPKQLLSKREFSDTFKKERNFAKKGICKYCVVPLPTCVLCNAYKSVYGTASYLPHRFKKDFKKETHVMRECRINESISPEKEKATYDASKYIGDKVDRNILNDEGNLKPIKANANKSYSVANYSGDDSDLIGMPPRSSTRLSHRNPLVESERYTKSVPPKRRTTPSKLFNVRTLSDDELEESEHIHRRIKNLMKKNNSVLQYDLSSSDSITDDECGKLNDSVSFSSLDDSPVATSKHIPAKSFVEPLTSEKKWSNRFGSSDGLSHREKLDARLKSIYADLYQKTLNNS